MNEGNMNNVELVMSNEELTKKMCKAKVPRVFTFIFLLFTIALLLLTSGVIADDSKDDAKKKFRVAIFDFKAGESITEKEAATITDMVRTEMIKNKKFTVIDRENIKRVLEEQGFGQKGCTDTSCEVQLGKLLAANKIMTGSISKLGNSYIINTQVTDVEKGTNDIAEKEKTKTIDDMDSAIKDLVEKIADAMESTITEEPKKAKGEEVKEPKKTVIKEENKEPFFKPIKFTISPTAKSVILPGWGQYANGQKLKASIYFLCFLASAGGLYSNYQGYRSAEDNYKRTANLFLLYPSNTSLVTLSYLQSESQFKKLESTESTVKGLSLLTVGIYVFNLIDIIFLGEKKSTFNNPYQQERGFQVSTQVSTSVYGTEKIHSINYTWRF
jgi:TolB-like protein